MMVKNLYQDKNWLRKQYHSLERNDRQIAQICECSRQNIQQWRARFMISSRSLSKAVQLIKGLHISLSNEAIEFLDGELLGDGHLSRCRDSSVSYKCSSKYKNYLNWLSRILNNYGIKQTYKITEVKSHLRNYLKEYTTFCYISRFYSELLDLHSRWYRKGRENEKYRYIKIIPKELLLTPLICRQWYIGDGSLDSRDKSIRFYSQCFTNVELNFLIGQLRKLGFSASLHIDRKIYLFVKSVPDFLSYIGQCPKEIRSIYGYKWQN